MPLLFHKYLQPEGELGLWQIAEDEAYFLDRMELFEKEKAAFERIKGRRQLEWLSSRWLLHILSGREARGNCLKDEHGKPYLENSFYDISISHSRAFTAVMAAPRAVGVDIQHMVEKIERIADKYMREVEMESLKSDTRLEHLHVYWGAKESLYKAYGRKKLDFCKHIHVQPFDYDLKIGKCRGSVQKEDYFAEFDICYEMIDDYMLVYALEAIGDQRIV